MTLSKMLLNGVSISSVARAILLSALALSSVSDVAKAAPMSMKRGINFEAWQKWTKKTDFTSDWYDRSNFPDWSKVVSDQSLAKIHAQGFDFVRLNVDPSPFMWNQSAAQDLSTHVLDAVNRIRKSGLKVLLDIHALPEGDDRPNGVHYVLGTGGEKSAAGFQAYLTVVNLLALKLAQLPATDVALELINEPDQDWFSPGSSEDRWPAQLLELYRTARRAAPDLTLVLTGARSGGIDGLSRISAAPFKDDPNVVWSFHFYEPMIVTHSGLPWESGTHHFIQKLPFPASRIGSKGRDDLLQSADKRITEEVNDPIVKATLTRDVKKSIDDYISARESNETIQKRFDAISVWAKANNVQPDRIILGEFGAFQDTLDPQSRANVLKATRQAAEAHGFAWAVYTAGLTSGQRSFGIMADPGQAIVEPLTASALGLR